MAIRQQAKHSPLGDPAKSNLIVRGCFKPARGNFTFTSSNQVFDLGICQVESPGLSRIEERETEPPAESFFGPPSYFVLDGALHHGF
jgi:hypothetical protein